jgi:DNA-binding Lrp family transcriptional regulator
MPETAYILIRLDRSVPAEIARQVRRVPGVAEVLVTMGDVDVLAIAHGETTRTFPTIGEKIQAINGVSSVSVCVVLPQL